MTFNVYSWFLCITWGGGGGSQSYDIIASWGLGIGEIYGSVCKFSSPLLSKKRSYIKNGEQQNSQMKVVDRCQNDPTKRQILEAIRIQRVPKELVMNGKNEWNTTRIPHIRVTEEN